MRISIGERSAPIDLRAVVDVTPGLAKFRTALTHFYKRNPGELEAGLEPGEQANQLLERILEEHLWDHVERLRGQATILKQLGELGKRIVKTISKQLDDGNFDAALDSAQQIDRDLEQLMRALRSEERAPGPRGAEARADLEQRLRAPKTKALAPGKEAPRVALGNEHWNPPAAFARIREDQLPNLPEGWAWQNVGGRWVPLRPAGAKSQPLHVELYTDGNGNANVVLRTGDGRFRSARALTRPKGSKVPERDYPVDEYHQSETGDPGLPWDRGHMVEHADTLNDRNALPSTHDAENFVPEPRWWNRWIRSPLVGKIRERGNGYRMVYEYGPSPRVTLDGTLIPDAVKFFEVTPKGDVVAGWKIPFKHGVEGPRGLDALDQFKMKDPSSGRVEVLPANATPVAGPKVTRPTSTAARPKTSR